MSLSLRFHVVLEGTSFLLCHNPQMIDPEFDLNRQIKALTKKRSKTDGDLKAIEDLEFLGGLYLEGNNGDRHVVQPCAKVRKCLIHTARITKQGKQIERAISFSALNVPLEYKGPREVDELMQAPQFRSRLPVVIGGKRIMRVRPQFLPWSLTVPGVMISDAGLNKDDFERIVALAGEVEGIGDNRVNGYGRFRGRVAWED